MPPESLRPRCKALEALRALPELRQLVRRPELLALPSLWPGWATPKEPEASVQEFVPFCAQPERPELLASPQPGLQALPMALASEAPVLRALLPSARSPVQASVPSELRKST